MLFSTDNEKSEVDNAGPIALAIDTVIWDKPLVAPRERLLGAEAVINIKITPEWK
jgi:hypothetical protein